MLPHEDCCRCDPSKDCAECGNREKVAVIAADKAALIKALQDKYMPMFPDMSEVEVEALKAERAKLARKSGWENATLDELTQELCKVFRFPENKSGA